MEQRLEELKGFMKKEREKRSKEPRFTDGSRWRSGTDKIPNRGYDDRVLNYGKASANKLSTPTA
jgi:hypothetical protein